MRTFFRILFVSSPFYILFSFFQIVNQGIILLLLISVDTMQANCKQNETIQLVDIERVSLTAVKREKIATVKQSTSKLRLLSLIYYQTLSIY